MPVLRSARAPRGVDRHYNYKSCRGCRKAKVKCEGLELSYLQALDDPNYVHPTSPLPQCLRCQQKDSDCTFDPVQRKGRPSSELSAIRRTSQGPRNRPLVPSEKQLSPNPSAQRRESSTRPSTASSDSSSIQGSPQSHPQPPSQTKSKSTSIPQFEKIGFAWIAQAYLSHIFTWNPILSPVALDLELSLATSDPLLLAAIACTVDPSLQPPPFPFSPPQILVSTLQAAIIFSLHAFGVGDQKKAVSLLGWASSELVESCGWDGYNEKDISPVIMQEDRKALVAAGWKIFWMSVSIGFLTGNRNLLIEVELPAEVTPRNMYHHALLLLRDATDADYLQALNDEDQYIYSDWIIGRAETIYSVGVNYLASTTPQFDPSSAQSTDPQHLVIAAAREQAFDSAILSAVSTILVLTRGSTQPRSLFPGLPIHLPQTSALLSDSSLASISRASSQILSLCQTIRNRQGNLLAFEQHSPTWYSSILVAAFGILVQLRTLRQNMEEEPSAGAGGAGGGRAPSLEIVTRQLEEDLDFCETVLVVQSKWSLSESCRVELVRMRASFSRSVNASG